MRHFTCVQDLGDLKQALNEAFEIKKDRFQFSELGKNKTLLMIFFNSSLRTRLSTQKAAMNLGMNTIVLDVNQGAWKLETERGVIMDGDKPEHLLEAVPVMGCYCDVIGVRSFARFENKEDDYNEKILSQFIEHSDRPVFSMEAATRHPLQSFADLITIEEYKKTNRTIWNETDSQAQAGTWYCVEGSCQHLRQILKDNKFMGGILVDQFYDNPGKLSETIEMNLRRADGLMVFDIVHIIQKNLWKEIEKGMREGGAI